jgi:hypothetical protein
MPRTRRPHETRPLSFFCTRIYSPGAVPWKRPLWPQCPQHLPDTVLYMTCRQLLLLPALRLTRLTTRAAARRGCLVRVEGAAAVAASATPAAIRSCRTAASAGCGPAPLASLWLASQAALALRGPT